MMKNLMAALLAAQRDCGSIAQDKKGPRGAYASVDAVVAECRQILHRHGLALIELRAELERIGDPDEEGRPLALRTHHVLAHEEGETLDLYRVWPVHAGRGRVIDHAVAAASSFGLTYLLRGLLLFPRGDHDIDTADRHQPHEPVKRREPTKVMQRPATKQNDNAAAIVSFWGMLGEALVLLDPADILTRSQLNELHKIAVKTTDKTTTDGAWARAGVELKKGAQVTAEQARTFALIIAEEKTK